VALASIQGLYSILQDKDKEIRDLRKENTELKEEIRDIGKRLAAIENQTPK
jgi:predicted  nucleic acid-binding Zn-ribbon protein